VLHRQKSFLSFEIQEALICYNSYKIQPRNLNDKLSFPFLSAVRADRMRGGRNKFGPMYKRDRARKLQILRQRQLALQAIRGSIGGGSSSSGTTGADGPQSQLSPTGYPPYSNMHIKQEIQIPQVQRNPFFYCSEN
jgi:hypothetical protein